MAFGVAVGSEQCTSLGMPHTFWGLDTAPGGRKNFKTSQSCGAELLLGAVGRPLQFPAPGNAGTGKLKGLSQRDSVYP